MGTEYIYKLCPHCNADGKIPLSPGGAPMGDPEDYPQTDCEHCGGLGKKLWGEIRDELIGEG